LHRIQISSDRSKFKEDETMTTREAVDAEMYFRKQTKKENNEERMLIVTEREWYYHSLFLIYGDFNKLPLAPKHTDEEVAEMEKAMHRLMDERHKLEARIKELEAQLEPRMGKKNISQFKNPIVKTKGLKAKGAFRQWVDARIKELEADHALLVSNLLDGGKQ
jgi:hypothetical protein